MRTYLIILIAFALVASYGCSDKKSAGRTPDETAALAKNRGSASEGNTSLVGGQNSEEMKKRRDAEQAKQDGETDENSDDESDVDSEEKSDASNDDDASKNEEARNEAPKRSPSRRGPGGLKRPRGKLALGGGGGAMADMTKKREDDMKRKEEEEAAENDRDSGLVAGGRSRDSQRETEAPVEVKAPTLLERAEQSFAMKHDPEAFQYLYAHYLVDDDALSSHPLGWYTGILEPRVGLRWGVAVNYSPGKFEGDPPRIGDAVEESESSNRRGGNRRGGGGGDFGNAGGNSSAGSGSMGISGGRQQRRDQQRNRQRDGGIDGGRRSSSSKSPHESLVYYTGDLGDKLIERYEMRRQHDEAFYGSIMETISTELKERSEDEGNNQQASQPPAERKRSSSNDDFGTMGGGNDDLERQRRQRNRGGLNSGGSRNDGDSIEYEAEETALAPGLMYLGEGSKKQMLSNAAKHNIDVLVWFDVKIKHTEQRNGDTDTTSRTTMKVYSVKTGEEMVSTKSLSHKAVAANRKKGRGDDPVEVELDKVFPDMADESFKANEMPDFGADKYRKRFEYLLKGDYDNPLPILVEIKHYMNAGYITQNDYIAACETFLDKSEAQDLIDGNDKKKEMALKRFLPGQFEVKVDTDGDEFR